MKKRFLSLLLVLAMLLTGAPVTTAAGSGFVSPDTEVPGYTSGPLQLPVDTVDGAEQSGMSQSAAKTGSDALEGEPKLVHDASGRFSLTEAAQTETPKDTDVVNFIVVMKEQPLLAAGFSTDEIAARTAGVTRYEAKQTASLNSLKTQMSKRFAADENFEIGFTYTVATTGVSVTTEYGNKEALEAMPGVDYVYVAPTFQLPEDYGLDTGDTYQPMTSNATTMIGADVLNETGYTGKGTKIAILDTGIVVDHPSFGALPEDKLTEDSLTKESVNAIWNTLNAGKTSSSNDSYYNSKIPFVFNYFTMGFDVSHATAKHDHGTHVAGIAAANKTESSVVIGVAPDAQLVVMQVFSSSGGAGWDTIMAALEDCVRLDVDSVNLSLGAAAGFTTSSDGMNEVLKRFVDTDIEVLIAAGNDTNNAYMNLTGLNMSKAGNPDIGLAGTPSTYEPAISVASVDNDGTDLLYFTVNDRKIGYYDTAASTATKFFNNFKGQTLEFVAVPGIGETSDYANVDVTGKVALVSRGQNSFPEKQAAAQAAGAIACVVYNNMPGQILMQINDGGNHIPCVSISMTDGQYLKEMATGSMTVCEGDLIHVKLEKNVSSFSSWGVTPDLKLKPEIAGVGGGIYSTRDPSLAGSYYGEMSGTSMATPQVTGAMAVLMQYLREHYDYQEAELRQVAANLMMSTANPVMTGDLEYSPRAQGAGLVDLVKATTSQAYLSSRDAVEGRPKGEFGDDDARTGTYEFGFEINNMSSDKDLTYTFDSSVLTESLYAGAFIANTPYALDGDVTVYSNQESGVLKYDFNDDGQITTADARALLRHVTGAETLDASNAHYGYTDVNGDGKTDKADVDVITAYCAELEVQVDLLEKASAEVPVTTVTIPAGETMSLVARVELTEADKQYIQDSFPNGMYVEGFLYVNSADEGGVDLEMPFVGFYGDWSDAPVFDEPGNDASLYERLVFTNNTQVGTNPYLRNGRSGDQYNAFSYANPLAEMDFGMLRNAKKMSFTVTDDQTGEVYFNITGDQIAKSYYNATYGQVVPFYVLASEDEVWNGMDAQGNKLPDGTKVTYEVKAWLDDGDDEVDDSFSFQITLDNEKPQIVNAYTLQQDLKMEDGKILLPLTLQDNQYMAAVLFVNPDGIIMGKYEVDNTPGQPYTAEYDITGFGTDFTIVVADYACNETEFDAVLDLGEYSDMTLARKQLSKDRLYGCETYDAAVVEGGWFSANRADMSDPKNETFDSTNRYYSAEYVNGYVVAQSAVTGDLMLVTPTSTYWNASTLVSQNGKKVGEQGVWVLYDMAMDYSGKYAEVLDEYQSHTGTDTLFAVGWQYEGDHDGDGKDDGHNTLFQIWMSKYNSQVFVDPIAPITGTQDGAELLTLGCTTDGGLYGIDTNGKLYSVNGGDGVCTYVGTTDFVNELNYSGCNVIQSMGYDHNTGNMYWYAHSQTANGNRYINVCMTYTVNLETGACTEVGTYGPSGQTCLFVPTDEVSDLFTMGVDPTSFEMSLYSLTMAQGQVKRLDINWTPWNAAPSKLTWTSSDESIATVNAYGYVTAVSEGNVQISATGRVWDPWAGEPDENWNYPGDWVDRTTTCDLRVVGSNDGIYGYVIMDYSNADNNQSWITYSDQMPGKVTQIAKQNVITTGMDGTPTEGLALWQGGTYYNGYVYTVNTDMLAAGDGTVGAASVLYRSKVTKGATPAETVIGEPEKIGGTIGVEVGNLGFDYNTGRMYCVDYTHGGLGIIDLDTGSIDLLGTYSGDIGGPAITPAMCVTAEGVIVVSDMYGALYTVDCDTLSTKKIGTAPTEGWYYAGMTYDYDTGNIYWNPCMNTGISPLYLVRLDNNQWSGDLEATIVDIGDVSSKNGVEQTAMFTIPTNEPETKHIPVEGIEITNGDAVNGLVGGTLQLETVTTPLRPTVQTRNWSTSDSGVVTVDRFGKLTFQGEGTATVTVSISNKAPEDGGPFTDTVEVTVYPAAGEMSAFVADDEGGSGYYSYWLEMHDYAVQESKLGDRAIGNYNIYSGTYYDGYYYGYNANLQFIRVNAEQKLDYTILTEGAADGLAVDADGFVCEQVTSMAYDYTDATMYGLVLPVGSEKGYLASVDLGSGAVTKLVQLDQKVFAMAIDGKGTVYAAGSPSYEQSASLYTIDKTTGACTLVKELPGAQVYTGANNYGGPRYNPQMTYDFTSGRLYLNATSKTGYYGVNSGMFMIDLDKDLVLNLGKPAIARDRVTTKVGNLYLGVLCAIPEEGELPESGVTGMLLSKEAARVAVDGTISLSARVRPSNATNKAITWSTSDPAIATVDENGTVTGVSVGTVDIVVTSVDNPAVSAACKVTVADVSGPQSVAYTVSAKKDALIRFNPELPGTTAEVITAFSGGTNVDGLDVDGDNLWYLLDDGGLPVLYRYDMVSKQTVSYGRLYTFGQAYDMSYDPVNHMVYVISGFMVFQFDVSKLDPNSLNWYTGYRDISNMTGIPTTHAVAVVGSDIYFLAKGYSGCNLYKLATDEVTHGLAGSPEVVIKNLPVNTNAYDSEMAYDSSRELFYVTDAASRLYSFDLQGNVTEIDILGDGIDINGIGITPAVTEQP